MTDLFASQERRAVREALTAALAVALAAYVSFGFLDLLVGGGAQRALLAARIPFSMAICLLALASRSSRLDGQAYALANVSALVVGTGCILLTNLAGGPRHPYHDALLLTMFGFSAVVPWRRKDAAWSLGLLLVAYNLMAWSWNQHHDVGAFVTHNSVYLVACALGALSASIGQKSRLARFLSQAKVQQALVQLQQTEAIKNQFFTNINHELRNPLSIVMAHLQGMAEALPSLDAVKLSQHVGKARAHALRLLGMVLDILDLTRLDMGKFRLRLSEINVVDQLNFLVQDVALLAAKKNIQVRLATPAQPSHHFVLEADARQLERVFVNLLTNAVKFTGSGGSVTIEVLEGVEPGQLSVEIADTGAGISEQALPFIFNRGYQDPSHFGGPEGNISEGLGLGLSLVKMIVEAHHGHIAARSEVGRGSCFTLTLLRKVTLAADKIERRSDARLAEDAREAGGSVFTLDERDRRQILLSQMARVTGDPAEGQVESALQAGVATVLVVDDSAEVTELLAQILSEYRIIRAQGGHHALTLAEQHRPELIITDKMMAQGSGLELVRALRAHPELKTTLVVMLSASGSEAGQLEAGDDGIDAYISKPFDANLVRMTVGRLLARHSQFVQQLIEVRSESTRVATSGLAHNVLNALNVVNGSLTLLCQQVEDLSSRLQGEDAQQQRQEGQDSLRTGQTGIARVEASVRALERASDVGTTASDWEQEQIDAIVQRAVKAVGGQETLRLSLQAATTVRVRPGLIEDVLVDVLRHVQQAAGNNWNIEMGTRQDLQGGGVEVWMAALAAATGSATPAEGAASPASTGLAISRRVLRDHGGHLAAEKRPGGSTRYVIWLPTTTPTRVEAGKD